MKRHEGREYTVLQGDVRETLASLPEQSVQCCVTSPPYWQLRSYLPSDHPDKPRELGQEKLHDCQGWATGKPCGGCFVCHMVEVFREVRRLLRDDGTLWLNLGDSYANSRSGPQGASGELATREVANHRVFAGVTKEARGLKPKDLCGIPWRLALALQADGWTLRQEIIWSKKSPMPESVRDRFTKAHEHIFLLSKSPNYYWDQEAIKEPAATAGQPIKMADGWDTGPGAHGSYHRNGREKGRSNNAVQAATRNPRSVWHLSTEPFPGAHFATFPTEIPRRAILAGTSERGCCPHCGAGWVRIVERQKHFASGSGRSGNAITGKQDLSARETNSTPDIRMGPVLTTSTAGWEPGCNCPPAEPIPAAVLDPFGGAGTTGVVALEHGRRAVLCELNPEYVAEHIVPRLDAVEARYGLFAG